MTKFLLSLITILPFYCTSIYADEITDACTESNGCKSLQALDSSNGFPNGIYGFKDAWVVYCLDGLDTLDGNNNTIQIPGNSIVKTNYSQQPRKYEFTKKIWLKKSKDAPISYNASGSYDDLGTAVRKYCRYDTN